MKNFAYFKIHENMTPYDASDIIAHSKRCGYDDIIVLHSPDADLMRAKYKEKLLSVFRAAYRHKARVYLADDRGAFSGTAFGQMCSVFDLCQRVMVVKDKDAISENDAVISEKEGKCIVAVYPKKNDDAEFANFPDLTNKECAQMIIDSVYVPILREYKKFAGYELKGFFCNRPVYNFDGLSHVPYSEEAVGLFEGDLFDVVNGNKKAEYLQLVRQCMENNFVKPVKKFCNENGMQFIIGGEKWGVSDAFCKKENVMHVTNEGGDGNYYPEVETVRDAIDAYEKKAKPVVFIAPDMNTHENIGKFFEMHPDCCVSQVEDLPVGKDCYVIINDKNKANENAFLLDGEWTVYDWEKDEWYDFEPKADYTIYPDGFMCLVKKKEGIYTDKLPIRISGVLCTSGEELKKVQFTMINEEYRFELPEDELTDCYIEFTGNVSELYVKMGGMNHHIKQAPFAVGLFNFLSGSSCVAVCPNGKIEEIVIKKRVV